jgi:acetoin utilization deacetylase AcuC-like enzyme
MTAFLMHIFYSTRFLEHSQGPGHPESPERLTSILDHLERSGLGYEIREPEDINEEELECIHTKEHIGRVKRFSKEEATFPDNRFYKNTFGISKLAAGAAWNAAEHVLKENEFAFALVRPPGHHAGRDSFAGFCYFNNLAFAAKKSNKRTMIIDIDVHHGNGTQDIFYNDESVFYLSLHQDPRTGYPGSGFISENNDHVLNVPLDSGTGDKKYLEALGDILEKAKSFKPEFIAISAGFDTYAKCPIASLGIEKSETYSKIGKMINDAFDCPKFAVLEGGYYVPKLGENVYNFLRAFK